MPPCIFFNTSHCTKGALCAFSHEPDAHSLQLLPDGPNICKKHLLDPSGCPFGQNNEQTNRHTWKVKKKCWYSHNLAHTGLPLHDAKLTIRVLKELKEQEYRANMAIKEPHRAGNNGVHSGNNNPWNVTENFIGKAQYGMVRNKEALDSTRLKNVREDRKCDYLLRPTTSSPTNTHIIDVSEMNGTQILQALESYNLPDPDIILQQSARPPKIDSSQNFTLDTKWSPLEGVPSICSTFSKAPSKPAQKGTKFSGVSGRRNYNSENWNNTIREPMRHEALEYQMDELLSQGIKPWDDGAWATLNELYDY